MRIVIAGAGEVGSHLAKLLSREEQDIIVLDHDKEKLAALDSNYNLMTVVGSPTSFTCQRASGVDGECDLFIAVTPYENTNLIACAMAKSLGARRTVGRIDNYEYLDPRRRSFFSNMGVDHLIYPEYLAAEEICQALRRPWARNWFELHDGELILVGVRVKEGADLINKQLREITFSQHHYHISAIKRRYETIIPRGEDSIKPGDILYFTTTREYVDEIRQACGKRDFKVKNVMIMGASRIARRLIHMASDKFDLNVIDDDLVACHKVPESCPGCKV